jgi:hypothetical protein
MLDGDAASMLERDLADTGRLLESGPRQES